jgi:1-acyl-sn-glycerol-3-phosphate acyltransferase
MIIIKSLLFNALFVLWTVFLCTIFLPLTWFGNKQASVAGRVWAWGIIRMLKFICGITHKIEGTKNIPHNSAVIISKHQSAWDTMIFFSVMKHPVFVMKKELLKIPLFGHFLAQMGMIPVNRNGGAAALKFMLREVKKRMKNGMSLVVFPEGTRTDVGQIVKYHPGIASIYQDPEIDVPFIPVALNSGQCWSRNSFIKKPGVITITFLKPIKKNIDRKIFMRQLQDQIETECRRIN